MSNIPDRVISNSCTQIKKYLFRNSSIFIIVLNIIVYLNLFLVSFMQTMVAKKLFVKTGIQAGKLLISLI